MSAMPSALAPDDPAGRSKDRLDLLDWRRRVADLYRRVRRADDPAEGHAAWVEGRSELLRSHPQSPVPADERQGFRLDVAPYDPDFRFVVPVEPSDQAGPDGLRTRDMTTGTDGVVRLERCGLVHLDHLGALDVWWVTGYGGGLFLPLRDATSGSASYGGGRYLLDTIKGADLGGDPDALVVDLNFAFPPSCAYDPAWACPLPGPGNRLTAPVPVGEQGPVH